MKAWLLISGAVLVSLVGCENDARPVEAVWGKQACSHCRMVLSEPRFAAQLVTSKGERLFFDDVGCMIEHEQQTRSTPAHVWVHGEQGTWVDAGRAKFVAGAKTPMDYGFAASASGTLDYASVRHAVVQRAKERQP
jgi:hypothetical protein